MLPYDCPAGPALALDLIEERYCYRPDHAWIVPGGVNACAYHGGERDLVAAFVHAMRHNGIP